jgi:starch synthase (maltosyl-transferring)
MTDRKAFRPRIYYVDPRTLAAWENHGAALAPHPSWLSALDRAKSLGFDTVLFGSLAAGTGATALPESWTRASEAIGDLKLDDILPLIAAAGAERGLSIWLDVIVDQVGADSDAHREHLHWYRRVLDPDRDALDPRRGFDARHVAEVVLDGGQVPEGFVQAWSERLNTWADAGIGGWRFLGAQRLPAHAWSAMLEPVRARHPDVKATVWTPGVNVEAVHALRPVGFDAVYASLPWWDFRAPWLLEEQARLSTLGAVIAPVQDPQAAAGHSVSREDACRALWTAVAIGDGVLVPASFEGDVVTADELATEIQAANQSMAQSPAPLAPPRQLTGPDAPVGALLRAPVRPGQEDARSPARVATLTVFNPDDKQPAPLSWTTVQSRLPDDYGSIEVPAGVTALQPGEVLHVNARNLPAVRPPIRQLAPAAQRKRLAAALARPRMVIEAVTPSVDNGAFPVKRTVARPVRVEADVFTDGHEKIGAAVWWRPVDAAEWTEVRMSLVNNDRWAASFTPERLGRHEFTVVAWRDRFATWRNEMSKKVKAGIDVSVEAREGKMLIAETLAAVGNREHSALSALAASLNIDLKTALQPVPHATGKGKKKPVAPLDPAELEILLSDALADAMQPLELREFQLIHAPALPLLAEREAAAFSSWYEIFPRSQSGDVNRHGTFDDVIATLPRVRDMGFDVLYFPPIHPIGRQHRKGRNNSLTAGPNDPGSPYAIGSDAGGHDALHPELGTVEDFRRLLKAAREHGLEIALDFAVQCSPDHPWLRDHPEWFAWRADGTIKYAENPPKKYEDIVNVEFYPPGTMQSADLSQSPAGGLWQALRDVVLHWAREGVRTFRVDNPHTKPLAFWEWMIAEVQAQYPDTLFLSEAFTKPKMMYRLAKVGFSQSYTYFTWRDHAAEMREYLEELNEAPVADFFRPHFFVNTPDINPRFLQRSGRAGFQIRAALAATLSGLWGVYNGFELCDATPMPGKEEYLDSEKYEIRVMDYQRPGNIVADITRLNHIRRSNPALQTHLGVTFHRGDNDQMLVYSKSTPERDNVVLVAVNMNPHAAQWSNVELARGDFGLPNDTPLKIENLLTGQREIWPDWHRGIYLDPAQPYGLWRISIQQDLVSDRQNYAEQKDIHG